MFKGMKFKEVLFYIFLLQFNFSISTFSTLLIEALLKLEIQL